MMIRYLLTVLAAGTVCAQEIASPLPADQMIAPEDKAVLDTQARQIFQEWDRVAVPIGKSVVALVAGNRQVALGTVVGKGKVLTKLSDLQTVSYTHLTLPTNSRV